jgi:hypothetical protein
MHIDAYLSEVREIVGDRAEVTGEAYGEFRWRIEAVLGEFSSEIFDCPSDQAPPVRSAALMVLDWAEASDG